MRKHDKIKAYAALAAFILVLGFAGKVDSAEPATHKAVELSDARRPAEKLAYLLPDEQVTFTHGRHGFNCRRSYFTDVSAYQWSGKALEAQRWNRSHTLTFWWGERGRVTFDGITFRNHSHSPVIVAGWCDN